MKILALVVLVAACSIQHKSDEYACTKTAECNNGRACVDGYCIVASAVDAPPAPIDTPIHTTPDAPACPAGCTTCNPGQHTCTIDCSMTNCNGQVACPAGYKCDILCDTDNSCRNGVDCQAAASCNITCSGNGSCRNLQCGAGPCDVNCAGAGACRNVACNDSCACDVTCAGNQSCGDSIQCPQLGCRAGLGCTSVPSFCHSCP
jgi:hypothetical protein